MCKRSSILTSIGQLLKKILKNIDQRSYANQAWAWNKEVDEDNGEVFCCGWHVLKRIEIDKIPNFDGNLVISNGSSSELYKRYFVDGFLDSIAKHCVVGNRDLLISVTMPNTINEIGRSAFEGCTSLRKVCLSSNLEFIDKQAFMGCTSLQEIVLPPTLRHIDRDVFKNCTSLKQVTIPSRFKSRISEIGIPTTATITYI